MDERVMAFFGLVNTLLGSVGHTSNHHLHIVRYSITPLSPTSGLIGWVPNCDTLHALIRQQRQHSKVPLHAEHGAIRKMSPESKDGSGRPNDNGFYNLLPMQKCEVFLQGIACTPGDDLANALWLKSPDAETWLLRRTNYTHSMAVMSMVGHVLGLGDRHPSNVGATPNHFTPYSPPHTPSSQLYFVFTPTVSLATCTHAHAHIHTHKTSSHIRYCCHFDLHLICYPAVGTARRLCLNVSLGTLSISTSAIVLKQRKSARSVRSVAFTKAAPPAGIPKNKTHANPTYLLLRSAHTRTRTYPRASGSGAVCCMLYIQRRFSPVHAP